MVSRRIQLGPVMEAYRDQIPAFISLFRALFGDFDIDEIMDNSSGYLNTLLFLGCANPERSTHRPRPLGATPAPSPPRPCSGVAAATPPRADRPELGFPPCSPCSPPLRALTQR